MIRGWNDEAREEVTEGGRGNGCEGHRNNAKRDDNPEKEIIGTMRRERDNSAKTENHVRFWVLPTAAPGLGGFGFVCQCLAWFTRSSQVVVGYQSRAWNYAT